MRDIGNPAPGAAQFFAEHADIARQRRHEAENGLDHGRLAGAVGPDDGDKPLVGRVEIEVPQGRLVVIGDGEAAHRKRVPPDAPVQRPGLERDQAGRVHGFSPACAIWPPTPFAGAVPPRARTMVVTL